MDRNSFEKVRLYQGVLVMRQNYHGDYAYPGGRVAVLDDNEMCVGAYGRVLCCNAMAS
jgi:hypothetical protein